MHEVNRNKMDKSIKHRREWYTGTRGRGWFTHLVHCPSRNNPGPQLVAQHPVADRAAPFRQALQRYPSEYEHGASFHRSSRPPTSPYISPQSSFPPVGSPGNQSEYPGPSRPHELPSSVHTNAPSVARSLHPIQARRSSPVTPAMSVPVMNAFSAADLTEARLLPGPSAWHASRASVQFFGNVAIGKYENLTSPMMPTSAAAQVRSVVAVQAVASKVPALHGVHGVQLPPPACGLKDPSTQGVQTWSVVLRWDQQR